MVTPPTAAKTRGVAMVPPLHFSGPLGFHWNLPKVSCCIEVFQQDHTHACPESKNISLEEVFKFHGVSKPCLKPYFKDPGNFLKKYLGSWNHHSRGNLLSSAVPRHGRPHRWNPFAPMTKWPRSRNVWVSSLVAWPQA